MNNDYQLIGNLTNLGNGLRRNRQENLSKSAMVKVENCLTTYKDSGKFCQIFSLSNLPHYMTKKEQMVLNDKVPSITIARETFGDAGIKTLLRSYVYDLAKYYGSTSIMEEQVEGIVNQILNFYAYLKPTEIMLAFEMMKAGKLRDGERDRAKIYGNFNSEVVMDCLYCFKEQYRDVIIEEDMQRKKKEELDNMERNAATPEQVRAIISKSNDPFLKQLAEANGWI